MFPNDKFWIMFNLILFVDLYEKHQETYVLIKNKGFIVSGLDYILSKSELDVKT